MKYPTVSDKGSGRVAPRRRGSREHPHRRYSDVRRCGVIGIGM